MYLRDPFTSLTVSRGDYASGLGQLATDDQALIRHMHRIAVSIADGQRRYREAMEAGDVARAAQWVESVAAMRAAFAEVAARFHANDPSLGMFDRIILNVGQWVGAARDTVVTAGGAVIGGGISVVGKVAELPKRYINYVGDLAGTATWQGVKVLIPLLVIGFGALWLLREAEKSPTVQAGVRRYV